MLDLMSLGSPGYAVSNVGRSRLAPFCYLGDYAGVETVSASEPDQESLAQVHEAGDVPVMEWTTVRSRDHSCPSRDDESDLSDCACEDGTVCEVSVIINPTPLYVANMLAYWGLDSDHEADSATVWSSVQPDEFWSAEFGGPVHVSNTYSAVLSGFSPGRLRVIAAAVKAV